MYVAVLAGRDHQSKSEQETSPKPNCHILHIARSTSSRLVLKLLEFNVWLEPYRVDWNFTGIAFEGEIAVVTNSLPCNSKPCRQRLAV